MGKRPKRNQADWLHDVVPWERRVHRWFLKTNCRRVDVRMCAAHLRLSVFEVIVACESLADKGLVGFVLSRLG